MNCVYVCLLLYVPWTYGMPSLGTFFFWLVGVSQGAQAHNKHRYKWLHRNGYRSVWFFTADFFCSSRARIYQRVAKKRFDVTFYLWYISFAILWFVVYLSFSENIDRDKNKKITKAYWRCTSFSSDERCFAQKIGFPKNYFILCVPITKRIIFISSYILLEIQRR